MALLSFSSLLKCLTHVNINMKHSCKIQKKKQNKKGSIVFLVNIFSMYEVFQPQKHLKYGPVFNLNIFLHKITLNLIRKVKN